MRLLATTEGIRRIDLEGASEITDAVVGVLTPDDDGGGVDEGGGTGMRLEHLVLSYAGRVTAEAMLRLVRGCKRLRVLEVDVSSGVSFFESFDFALTSFSSLFSHRTRRSPIKSSRSSFVSPSRVDNSELKSPLPTRPSSFLSSPCFCGTSH